MTPYGEPYYIRAEYVNVEHAHVIVPFWHLGPAINAAVAMSEDYNYYRISVTDTFDNYHYLVIVGRGHAKPAPQPDKQETE
jgi:hypothetical protein